MKSELNEKKDLFICKELGIGCVRRHDCQA